MLANQAASNPSSTSRWRVLATVSTLLSSAAAIWLSLQPHTSEASAFNRDPGPSAAFVLDGVRYG